MTTHETLVAAKAALMERGWFQGEVCKDKTTDSGPVCLMGAINMAVCGSPTLANLERPFAITDRDAASDVLVALLGNGVAKWNDEEAVSVDEVVDVLDRAILATAPKDTPAPQPETPSPSVTHVFA